MLTTAVGVAATLIALCFAMATFEKWLVGRSPQNLLWTIALALFVVGALALAMGSSLGWSLGIFKLFYITGAICNVPILACGQLYLLISRRRATQISVVVAFFLTLFSGIVIGLPAKHIQDAAHLPKGDQVFGAFPRILAAVGSGGGAMVIIVGTVIGVIAILRQRSRALYRRALGLVLLSVGTIVLGASGLLNSVFGEMGAFSITLMIGVTILFAGFLLAGSTLQRHRFWETTP